MKRNNFIDFIIKNKYIILFVTIALILICLGIVKFLVEIGLSVFLVLFAVYLGKRIQDDESYIKKMFKDKYDIIYDEENKEDKN